MPNLPRNIEEAFPFPGYYWCRWADARVANKTATDWTGWTIVRFHSLPRLNPTDPIKYRITNCETGIDLPVHLFLKPNLTFQSFHIPNPDMPQFLFDTNDLQGLHKPTIAPNPMKASAPYKRQREEGRVIEYAKQLVALKAGVTANIGGSAVFRIDTISGVCFVVVHPDVDKSPRYPQTIEGAVHTLYNKPQREPRSHQLESHEIHALVGKVVNETKNAEQAEVSSDEVEAGTTDITPEARVIHIATRLLNMKCGKWINIGRCQIMRPFTPKGDPRYRVGVWTVIAPGDPVVTDSTPSLFFYDAVVIAYNANVPDGCLPMERESVVNIARRVLESRPYKLKHAWALAPDMDVVIAKHETPPEPAATESWEEREADIIRSYAASLLSMPLGEVRKYCGVDFYRVDGGGKCGVRWMGVVCNRYKEPQPQSLEQVVLWIYANDPNVVDDAELSEAQVREAVKDEREAFAKREARRQDSGSNLDLMA